MNIVTNEYVWNLAIKPLIGFILLYIGAMTFMKILEHYMVKKLEEKQ